MHVTINDKTRYNTVIAVADSFLTRKIRFFILKIYRFNITQKR